MAEFLDVRSTIISTNSLNSFFEMNKKFFYIEADRRRHIHIDWDMTTIRDSQCHKENFTALVEQQG